MLRQIFLRIGKGQCHLVLLKGQLTQIIATNDILSLQWPLIFNLQVELPCKHCCAWLILSDPYTHCNPDHVSLIICNHQNG